MMLAILGKIAASAAFKYVGVPILASAAALALYAWITTGAYKRGYKARDIEAVKVIAEKKAASDADAQHHQRMTPDELDEELRKKCRAAGGTEEECR